MSTRWMFVGLICVLAALGMAGCASGQSQVSPTQVPPTAVAELPTEVPTAVAEPMADPATGVVMEMVARANAADWAGAADLVADDMMTYLIGMPPTGIEIYRGKEQFQTFLEECCTGQNFVWEVNLRRVEDGVVYAESKTWMDFTRDLGVAPNQWHEVFAVADGKITLYASTITEDALAAFKPAIFTAIPELATAVQPPVATNETPATALTVTIANGTCTTDGPMTLQAGELPVQVVVEDQDGEYAVTFFTLDEGKDMIDLMAATYNPVPPSWSRMVFIKEVESGQSQTYNGFFVEEGLLYLVCWAKPPEIVIGNAGPFVVMP